MIPPEEDYATRRQQLAEQIERQRGQLAAAYNDLEKPILYAEYGIRTVGFLRQNAWIFVAVPTTVKMAFSILGLKKKPSKSAPGTQNQGQRKSTVVNLATKALEFYQLYRRVRSFIP